MDAERENKDVKLWITVIIYFNWPNQTVDPASYIPTPLPWLHNMAPFCIFLQVDEVSFFLFLINMPQKCWKMSASSPSAILNILIVITVS